MFADPKRNEKVSDEEKIAHNKRILALFNGYIGKVELQKLVSNLPPPLFLTDIHRQATLNKFANLETYLPPSRYDLVLTSLTYKDIVKNGWFGGSNDAIKDLKEANWFITRREARFTRLKQGFLIELMALLFPFADEFVKTFGSCSYYSSNPSLNMVIFYIFSFFIC